MILQIIVCEVQETPFGEFFVVDIAIIFCYNKKARFCISKH